MGQNSDYQCTYSDDPAEETQSGGSKFQIVTFIVAIISVAFVIRGVYAANINLSSGGAAEFGQGIATSVSCSGNNVINIKPQSTFVNVAGGGAFYLSGLQISGVPTECIGKKLSFSAYGDSSSDALPIFASTQKILEVTATGSSFTTSNSGVSLSEMSGSAFTATFNSPVTLTSDFVKITAQSSEDPTFQDLGSIAFGASDLLSFASTSAFGTGAFTIEMWVKFTGAHGNNALLVSGSGSPGIYINSEKTQISITKWPDGTGTQVFYVNALSDNTWYHFAVVRDSSNKAQLFIEGAKSLNSAITDTNNYSGGINAFASGGAGGKFIGRMTNIRITNTAVYDPTASTITKPTSPLSNISGTLLLLNTKPTAPLNDSSSSPTTISTSGSPTSTTDNPFS